MIQTQNNVVYGELDRTSLKNGRVINVIQYWLKVVQHDDMKYVKIVNNVMCRNLAIKPNSTSLAKSVRHLLQSISFNNVWMNQGVGNGNLFIRTLKERVIIILYKNWNLEMIESLRARTYILFCKFRLQPYQKCITLDKFRISLSRLRMYSHRLKVETGRWQKPTAIPFNERTCTLCLKLKDE